MESAIDAAAELCALKCSTTVDAARDTVSASFAAAVVAGEFCATSFLDNDVVSTYDVLQTVVEAGKKSCVH
jgi:hypothetical protein